MDRDDVEEILNNEFAEELELDEVVNSIESIYQCIDYKSPWKQIEGHLSYLKYVLKETTKEHDQYHNYHGGWLNKLTVAHSRRPYDTTFVTAIWDVLLAAETAFLPHDSSPDDDMRTLLNEVQDTAEECGIGGRSFPMNHLVRELEDYSCQFGANPEKVQAALISLDVPFRKLYLAYRSLNFFDEEPDDEELSSHHLKAFASLIQSFIRKYNVLNMDESERKSVISLCKGDVQRHLQAMYEYEDDYTPKLIKRYEKLEKALEHF